MSLLFKVNMAVRKERGMTLVETIVALAILGTIVLVFLGGIIGSTKAAGILDEKATAESLAQSQMEYVQNTAYAAGATQYTAASIPSISDYSGYSANITVAPVHATDDGIQLVTVSIQRSGKSVATLVGYKVNR